MKKKILLVFLLILVTGCEATCNIEVKNDKILNSCDFYATKNIKYQPNSPGVSEVYEIENNYYKQDYMAFYNNPLHDELYNKKLLDNGQGMNLNYSYSLENFSNSSLLKYCGGKATVDDNNIVIDVKDSSKCFTQDPYEHLDLLNIKIKTDLKVLESNADSVTGNTYIWQLERGEKGKKIHIKIHTGSAFKTEYLIVLFVIVAVGVGIYIFRKLFKGKVRASNEF